MKGSVVLILVVFLFSCSANKAHDKNDKQVAVGNTTIKFTEDTHNFGQLKAGEIVVYTFEFTNTGTDNFLISGIDCGCGCVATEYIKEAVKPGEKGWIEVEFDSSGLAGREYKSIDVHGNINELKHLAIFAEVDNELLNIKY